MLVRILREDLLNPPDDWLDGGDRCRQLEKLGVALGTGLHYPINDFGRQLGILGNDIARRAVATLRT